MNYAQLIQYLRYLGCKVYSVGDLDGVVSIPCTVEHKILSENHKTIVFADTGSGNF